MANRRPYRVVDIGPTETRPATPLPQLSAPTATETPECIDTGFWAHFLESNQDLYPREKRTDFYYLLCALANAIGDFPDTRLLHDRGQLKIICGRILKLVVLLDGLRRYYLSYESAVLGTAQWTPRANISLRYLQTIMAMGMRHERNLDMGLTTGGVSSDHDTHFIMRDTLTKLIRLVQIHSGLTMRELAIFISREDNPGIFARNAARGQGILFL